MPEMLRVESWEVKSPVESAGELDGANWLFCVPFFPCSEVLRRKSCVTAIPMLAKEREVRSQARKVRSIAR